MSVYSKVVITALSAAAVGAVVAPTLLAGSASSGARGPLRGSAAAPVRAPVSSAAFPPGLPSARPNAAPPTLTVEVAHCVRFGPVLVTPAGLTVYRQVAGGVSDPGYHPLLATSGQRLRLPILVGGRLGTVRSVHGGLQVTYDGWQLYVYSGDHVQGDTNGAGPRWRVIPLSP
jgi:hypothetical protein